MFAEGSIPMSSSTKDEIDFEKFRNIVKSYLDKHHYKAAEFWANKLVSLSGSSAVDVYYLAKCYFHLKKYHRAIVLLTSHDLLRNPKCRYLCARCHFEAFEYQTALDLLSQNDEVFSPKNKSSLLIPEIEDSLSIESSVHLLQGYIHEAMDNRVVAVECFESALQCDPFCFEAFSALTQHNMLSLQDEKALLGSIQVPESCNEVETTLLKVAYESQLNKYSGVSHKLSSLPCSLTGLVDNLDIVTAEAESLYYLCDFTRSFKLTQRVLQVDPYHPQCLLIHIACQVELKQTNELFLLAHKLVDFYPEDALSWFAVGCYYYLIGKYDNSRRFLSKATTLDRVLGPAWIAYGHAFAAENEHDQARAAYYKAAQLMQGCHLPLLYIGMEYSLTNNPKFAEKFFIQALEIAPNDPFVHHELGVVAFTNLDFPKAEKYFCKAVTIIEDGEISVIPEKWATLLQNVGQTYCKLGKYEDSIELLRRALKVSQNDASIYASIGLVHSYLGQYHEAVEVLHKALSLQKDHTIASSLLSTLMNQIIVNSPGIEDVEEISFEVRTADHSTTHKGCSVDPYDDLSLKNDDVKNSMAFSIGQPMMNSSNINDGTRNQADISSSSSGIHNDDMELDDSCIQ